MTCIVIVSLTELMGVSAMKIVLQKTVLQSLGNSLLYVMMRHLYRCCYITSIYICVCVCVYQITHNTYLYQFIHSYVFRLCESSSGVFKFFVYQRFT